MKKITNSIIEMLKDNRNILKKLNEEDNEINKFEFEVDKLISVLEDYKGKKVNENNGKKILVNHYGNPYITAMLCLESIINKSQITIGIEDICVGLNKAIVKIVNDVLKENKIQTQIILKNNLSNTEIEQMELDKVICLGNSNSYMKFRNIKNIEMKNISLFDISLYYDSEEYAELAESIRNYAEHNFYEIEIFDETEDFEDVIYMMNHSENKYCAVILSKNKDKQEKFKQEINSKIVCINENPFKQFEFKIPNEIF